jgi:DNA-directed RNA polymerase specialized sigma24 family protein/catechol 2,3-dioxygenase-like lactoylglutathione lyase family enzyme
VSGQRLAREDPAGPFLDLYDRALPQVYGYLLSRCGQRTVAEDLTAETFLAAVDAVRGVRGAPPAPLSTGWLIGVARHKLCDHWRRQAREQRTLRAVAAEREPGPADPWDETLDAVTAREVLGRRSVSLVLSVADVDDVVAAAVEAGARLDRQPYEGYGHRSATVTDPYGHRWLLEAPLPGAVAGPAGEAEAGTAPLRQGDVSYMSLWVPDVARAAAFYGAVLGLEYLSAHEQRGRQAPGSAPPQGLWEVAGGPAVFCSYVVDDAAAAVARVRAAGGQAEEPVSRPYGLTADCVDADGVRFALHQPLAGPAAGRRARA